MTLPARLLTPRTCPYGHEMEPREYRTWYCDHRECGVLTVKIDFPGSYRLHSGTHLVHFSREEAQSYLQGNQTIDELIEDRMKEARLAEAIRREVDRIE